MRLPSPFAPLLLVGLYACQSSPTESNQTTPGVTDSIATAAKTASAPAPPAPAPPLSTEPYPYAIPPVNEVGQDPELLAFVQRVQRACAARQQSALLALVDDSVLVSGGGGLLGKRDFVTDFLNNGSPGNGFATLLKLLRLGGTISGNEAGRRMAIFPYLQDDKLYQRNRQLASLDLDPYISFVGTARQVAVHEQPSRRSRVLRRLEYPVLLSNYEHAPLGLRWVPVTAPDSSFQGYAESHQLYCLADITLIIEKKNGAYRITSVSPFD